MIDESCDNLSYPTVTVVMAVYKPRLDWLAEQLRSLDRQTYGSLELIVCDDCPDAPVEEAFYARYITRIPFRIMRNAENIGSNKTFERLTLEATGPYIAYCDQDDIWEDNKIDLLVRRLEETSALLCFSDLSIIDKNGGRTADSITDIRRRHVFREGENLASELLVRNFVTGCAMLMRTEIAKAAVPFEEYMVHDHWLALFSALNGRLSFEPTATVRYRQHGDNQTGVLTGVSTKEDYLNLRIEALLSRTNALTNRLQGFGKIQLPMENVFNWVLSRKAYFLKPSLRSLKALWKFRRCGFAATLFEIFIPVIPKPLFTKVVILLR